MSRSQVTEMLHSQLEAGRTAAARSAWAAAYPLLAAADDAGDELTPDDLEALAEASFVTADYERSLRARERAYAVHLEAGERAAAALSAIKLCAVLYPAGELAVAAGWQSTAERLLEDEPESRAHGMLAWIRSRIALLFERDMETADAQTRATAEIGARLGDLNLQMLGLAGQARVHARAGRAAESARLLDEAMATALAGGLRPWAACIIFCDTLSMCQELGDYRRAAEWAKAASSCSARDSIVPTSGECRTHKAGVLRMQGQWDEAENEARAGCEEHRMDAVHVSLALYEIGEIKLRKGDLEAADELFAQTHEMGRSPQPGLALLRLQQGRRDAARSMIDAALEEETLALPRIGLLAAQIEIALAAGDAGLARAAAVEIEELAEPFDTAAVQAMVAAAAGAAEVTAGDAPAACASLRRAERLWQDAGVPYEGARVRMLLARALIERGDSDGAALEARSARSAFDRLGAMHDARRAGDLLRAVAAVGAPETAERAVRAFMFTDMVKSTPLIEAIGDDAWTALLRWHDATLRRLFAKHGGEEISNPGDGFFVAFPASRQALECAVEIQRTLSEHRETQGFSPQVRIGVHQDEAMRSDMSYEGRGVHVAARIGSQAVGGEILASRETAGGEDAAFPTTDPREVTLKGVTGPVEVVSIAWD